MFKSKKANRISPSGGGATVVSNRVMPMPTMRDVLSEPELGKPPASSTLGSKKPKSILLSTIMDDPYIKENTTEEALWYSQVLRLPKNQRDRRKREIMQEEKMKEKMKEDEALRNRELARKLREKNKAKKDKDMFDLSI